VLLVIFGAGASYDSIPRGCRRCMEGGSTPPRDHRWPPNSSIQADRSWPTRSAPIRSADQSSTIGKITHQWSSEAAGVTNFTCGRLTLAQGILNPTSIPKQPLLPSYAFVVPALDPRSGPVETPLR
jgi:hypothetical protein